MKIEWGSMDSFRVGAIARIAAVGVFTALLPPAKAQPSSSLSGERLFVQQCAACHSLEQGEVRVGPSLHNIDGRRAGSIEGFPFSPVLSASGLTWSATSLDRWLTDSSTAVPGSAMKFKLADAKKRALIIDYLTRKSQKSAGDGDKR